MHFHSTSLGVFFCHLYFLSVIRNIEARQCET
jgi:hypothetical protein